MTKQLDLTDPIYADPLTDPIYLENYKAAEFGNLIPVGVATVQKELHFQKKIIRTLVWETNNQGKGSEVKLLEQGNLVFLDGEGKVVWQSFDSPTDTLLPGMNLIAQRWLSSWKSSIDPPPAKHHSRSHRKPKKWPQFLESQQRQALPPIIAPSNNVHHLSQSHTPSRNVVRCCCTTGAPLQNPNEKKQQAGVYSESHKPHPSQNPNSALCLQKLLGGEINGQGEHLRYDLNGKIPG
nr:G-type lectin S-receptor-like serine/threonine-protein kinase SD2-2 [Ipomoea batatas]